MPATDCKTFGNVIYKDGLKEATCSVCGVGKIYVYQINPPIVKEIIHNPAGHI